MSNTVITLSDYERIFRLIYSVLDTRAHTPHACVFFSLVGAAILETHYKIKANPVAGAAAFVIGADIGEVVTFGKLANGDLVSSSNAFHCWIESDGVVVDFMTPIFEESFKACEHKFSIPRRMFQKPKVEMSNSVNNLCHKQIGTLPI